MEVGNLEDVFMLNLAYVKNGAPAVGIRHLFGTYATAQSSTGLSRGFNAWQFPTGWGDPTLHRRYGVSLLSSAWGQVGPPR